MAGNDKDISTVLKGIKVDDVQIDPLGRVVLNDPELAALLGSLQGGRSGPSIQSNVGCCDNGALCKKPTALEIRELLDPNFKSA